MFNESFQVWHKTSTEVMSYWNSKRSLKDEIDFGIISKHLTGRVDIYLGSSL